MLKSTDTDTGTERDLTPKTTYIKRPARVLVPDDADYLPAKLSPNENGTTPLLFGSMAAMFTPRGTLKRLESLGKIASPRAGILKSPGSFSSLGSFTSLSSLMTSPGSRSRSGSKSIFTREDDVEGLLLKFYSYDDLKLIQKPLSFHTVNADAESSLPEIIKIPLPFLITMKLLWRRHKIFATWRLSADPYSVLNRRRSLIIDSEIFYSPKDTNTSTQTGSVYTITGGYIAREPELRDQAKPYRMTDNNFSGAFHHTLALVPNDLTLLQFLKDNLSQNIHEAKYIHNMITFSEYVESVDKQLQTQGLKLKHYIQATRTIFFVTELIEKAMGIFISASTSEIIFQDSQMNICKLELSNLLPPRQAHIEFKQFKNFVDFCIYISEHELEDSHGAMFRRIEKNGGSVWVPINVATGKNGCPIAGDVDPEAIAERHDIPSVVYKSFYGATADPNLFLIGLEILAARLKYTTAATYNSFIERLGIRISLLDNSEIIGEAYSKHLRPASLERYKDYTKDSYYAETYLPIVEATLALYTLHPELLLTVGRSSIGGLVVHHDFDNEQYIHDADNLNQQANLGPMGVSFFYYETISHPDGILCITGNEESYVKFLLHDPEILKHNRVCVHPCRLGNEASGAYCSEFWLDIIRIQALFELAKGTEEFIEYQHIVLEDMHLRHSTSEEIAVAKLKLMFDNLYIYIGSSHAISEKINRIYSKYADESKHIHSRLSEAKIDAALPKPGIESPAI